MGKGKAVCTSETNQSLPLSPPFVHTPPSSPEPIGSLEREALADTTLEMGAAINRSHGLAKTNGLKNTLSEAPKD